jgi:hypothetical protein
MVARITLAFIVAVVLTVIPAILQGNFENRWGDPADLTAAAKRVEELPRDFGDWKLTSEGEPLLEVVYAELGLSGYVSRTYTHKQTGATVSLLLMAGKSGPLIRHPPNICYANRANEQVGEMTKMQVDVTEPTSEFNLLEYKRLRSLTDDRFLVAYAMATGPTWLAPSVPRIEFGGAPVLYKVQMLVVLNPSQTREFGVEIVKQFAADFCTAFQEHVLHEKRDDSRQARAPQSGASSSSS